MLELETHCSEAVEGPLTRYGVVRGQCLKAFAQVEFEAQLVAAARHVEVFVFVA